MKYRKYLKILSFIAVSFLCLILCIQLLQIKNSKDQNLQNGVYLRQDSSLIGYVVINRSKIGSGQQIIVRDKDGKLIDQGSIRFKENKGIINLKNSSRIAAWVNKTTFTTDDENVVWLWNRNFKREELSITW